MLVALALSVVAFVYAAVGHAGASGYLAVLALHGLSPAVLRPSALALNLVVASLAALVYLRAGHFSWGTFWPIAAFSIPAAWFGGALELPVGVFRLVLAVVLVGAALALFRPEVERIEKPRRIPVWLSAALGLGIGFVSGLVGVGGGVFLTPVLILGRFTPTKTAAGISALFILVNSSAALAGNPSSLRLLPPELPLYAAAVAAAGWLGACLGAGRLPPTQLRRLLALVLVVAAAKFAVT